MLHITEDQVLRHLTMKEAMRLVRDAFAGLADGSAQNQARRRLMLPGGAVLHQLAGSYGRYFGAKIYSTHPKHGATFHVLLYDAETGKPLAIVDANHLGQIRTGAASGVATQLLARPDAAIVAVIGSGFQAMTQVDAMRVARRVKEIRVWSRNRERREAFAREMEATAVETAEQAVRGADIIVTATNAKDPVIESAWVSEGAHINAMGSNNPRRREIPADLVARASLVALDARDQSMIEAGDLILAWQPEDWNHPRVVEMKDVVSGAHGRTSESQITLFKSNGLGVQDVAAAGYVYSCAPI